VQIGARERAVRDRLEVDDDHARRERVASDGDHVVGGHHDRVALEEAPGAGVDDHHIRPVLVERRGHLVAPDRVAGDVEDRLALGRDDEARDRRHQLADPAGPVTGRRAGDPHAVPVERIVDRPHIGEAVPAQRLRVLRLADDRQVGGQQLDRGVVEMVAMQVGDDRGVEGLDDDLGRLRQLDERVAPRIRRVLDRRARAGGIEHRVHQHAPSREPHVQGGVADEAQAHPC
jgi:hypothetical protein